MFSHQRRTLHTNSIDVLMTFDLTQLNKRSDEERRYELDLLDLKCKQLKCDLITG